ncbi:MAG: sensor histidine kinase, partial [Candidatus Krumholzibacteriia bacterium]
HEVEATRLAISSIRQLSRLLHPPELEIGDVFSVVQEHICSLPGSPKITCTRLGEEPPLPPDKKGHLFRIVQEAVTNAVKHARPGRIRIRFRWYSGSLELMIEDDGRGIADSPESGVGMRSIRDRAAILGGAISWTHGPAGGTIVKLEVRGLAPPELSRA